MKISFFQIINYIKKKKIQDVYFVDSYGGIKKFFDLFEQFNEKRNFIILCSNIEVFKFLSSVDIYKKNVFYYSVKNFINFIIFLKIVIKILKKNFYYLLLIYFVK